MAAIWMWARSEQRQRWASLLGLAVVIAVGAGCALALAAGAHRADTVYERFAIHTGAASIVMEPNGEVRPTSVVDANRHLEVLDRVRAIDGVESVQVQTWFGAASDLDSQAPDSSGLVTAFSVGYSYFDSDHPPFLIVAGTLPGSDDPQGIVINEAAARQGGLTIGSTVNFETASTSQFVEWWTSDGKVSSYGGPRVHAVVRAIARSIQEIIDPATPYIAVMPGLTAAIDDTVVNCSCFVAVGVKPGQLDEVGAQLEAIYEPYNLVVRPGDSASSVTAAIRVEVTTVWIAALVAALAALLIVAQFTARSAASIAARNAARRALGMTRGQCAGAVALVLAPALLAGVLVGAATAYFLSGLFPRGLALQAEPEPGLRLDPVVLGGGGLGFVVAMASLVAVVSWLTAGVRKSRSPRPARAITGFFAGDPKRALGCSFALDPVGGRPIPVIAVTTLIGVALASGGIVAVSTIQQSRNEARSDRQIFGAPAHYWYDDNGETGAAAAIERAQRQAGITAITRTVSIDDATSVAIGPSGLESQVEPTSFERLRGSALPTIRKGTMPRAGDEVALGTATARALGARIGDTVAIADVSGSARNLRVVGLVALWSFEDPGHAFLLSDESLLGLLCVGGVERGCGLRISVWVETAEDAAGAALTEGGFTRISPPANLDRLQQVGNIPWYLAGILAVLGLSGIAHAVATALRRRRIDLAIGRALGWTPGQSAAVLFWQAVMMSLAGSLVGALLGLLVGRSLWTELANGLDIVVRPARTFDIAALAIAALVAASILFAVPALLRVRRLRTTEILRTD